ncbi:kynureninase [Sphingomonas histidinilytica]|uniref:Kynureninase n=1 Tax=Rhizorhabdus histidinilytica TaxID=439228 RepID=A0A1T5GAS1_9SPHN|nr:kynureninase [Rhizorhabdus histidinilytica]MBO9380770.1 kynureninase [Rhizorhabdus histidinilytica]QEH77104.1 kynureninase [Sphingomonas sp. C8-2]SKC05524.1 Kynureninase [Rhizorhabdus histidinilytica]
MMDLNRALEMDRSDPLAGTRAAFALPEGVIYLDGNSLGALPCNAAARVAEVISRQWGHDLIQSWNRHDWISMPARVGDRIARLIGADAGEVVAADSTSVNLMKLLSAALKLRPGRRTILSDNGNFPNDLYIAQGVSALLGEGHVLRIVDPDKVGDEIDGDTAILMLTEVDYRSGRRHDMRALTSRAHAAGALVIWDLCHSAGAMDVDLNAAGADMAVGCGYKYLNGGPGAPAFMFVARRLQGDLKPALSGWMGHDRPFDFDLDYRPATGVVRNLAGTPPIIGLTALDAALDAFDGVDMRDVRRKSLALGDLFIELARERLARHGLEIVTPEAHPTRGSQVSLRHPEAYAIVQALIAEGVVGDFRMPDIARFGFAPLYTSFADIWHAIDRLEAIMAAGSFREARFRKRLAVT